jgi:acyl-CoA thioester hydrolase
MARSDFRMIHPLRVRWAEVDRQGIVFNGNYLLYFDIGVTEYWRAIGCPYPEGLAEHGSDLFVRKATVEYHGPSHYDDLLDLCVRVQAIGRSSIRFAVEIHRADALLVSGELVYVNADPVARAAAPVPAFLREAIGAFEGRSFAD